MNKTFFTLTLILILQHGGNSYANRGKDIFLKTDRMDKGYKDQRTRIKMTLINASGEKIIRIMDSKRLEGTNDGDLSLIRFIKPNDVKNTSLLTYEHKKRSDDQWMYLPVRKRIKRISSDNKSGSFMGSEFSYEDMGSREVEKYRYKYLRDGTFNGNSCFVVERYPTDRSSGYSKLITWVRKDIYQPVKIDYYDRKREHLKTLLLKKLQKHRGKHWRAHYLVMDNIQTGKKTIIQFLNLRIRTGLSKSMFSKRALGKR